VGTYLVHFKCINCKVGTYQPLVGQTECVSCPSGYTTSTYGSSDISECSGRIYVIKSLKQNYGLLLTS
jgi:hypothetical protein